MRHKTRHMWQEGRFTILSEFSREKDAGASEPGSDIQSSFDELKARYNLTGNESYNLIEAGLDSLDLVVFMHELKELLKEKKGEPDPRREPMSRLLKGLLPAYVYCPTASDVHRAVELSETYGFKIKLVLGRDGWKAAAEIAKKGLEAILDPDLEYWETDEDLHDEVRRCGAEAPAKAGVKFALQTDAQVNGSGYLWYQAATAVRNGLTRAEALRSITLAPAEILGLGSRLGSIEKGKDGTVVVLTGDPLDSQSWVDLVLVEGKVVYDRSKDEKLRRILEARK